jgi:beta-lactamase regulating signal transducer with metallopeptidase domain
MNEVAFFFAQCAQSKAVLGSICAIIVIPPAAWIASRLLAPQILRMRDDPAWQAPYAAVAASLPGVLFLVLSVFALVRGASTACWTMPGGRIVFSAIALVAVTALVRAAWLAFARNRELRHLVRFSRPASKRLQKLADACSLRAREIYDDAPVCALAGVVAPIVLVSGGALRALGDEELKAALLHERAHTMRGDQILAVWLSFFVDLLPLPACDLVETYKLARELAADRCAARTAGNDALARALVGFAKSGRSLAGATSFSGSRCSTVVSRIAALLQESPPRGSGLATPAIRRLALGLALATIVTVGIAAPVLSAQRPSLCSIHVNGTHETQ